MLVALGQGPFQRGVLLCGLRMGAQVIAKSQVELELQIV